MFAKELIISKNGEIFVTHELPKATRVISENKRSTVLILPAWDADRLHQFLMMLDYDSEVLQVSEQESKLVLIAFNANKYSLEISLRVIP